MDDRAKRSMVAMSALAALKHYAFVFPDDTEPYRAVAAILADDVTQSDLDRRVDGIEQRLSRVEAIAAEFSLSSGAIMAALEALRCVRESLRLDADPNDVRTHLLLAQHARELGLVSG